MSVRLEDLAEASAFAILSVQSRLAASTSSILRDLSVIFRYLRSEECLSALPLVIPRALLFLCRDETASFEFRGQLFAALGTFVRLEPWFPKSEKTIALRKLFEDAERFILKASKVGGQKMVIPIAAAILYSSEIPGISFSDRRLFPWPWARTTNRQDSFGLMPRLLRGVLFHWCGLGNESTDASLGVDKSSVDTREYGNARISRSPKTLPSNWTLTDFYSLMYAVEKAISNLFSRCCHRPMASQGLCSALSALFNFTQKSCKTNSVIVATVASALLAALPETVFRLPNQPFLLKLFSKVSSIPLSFSPAPERLDVLHLAYLLALARIGPVIDYAILPQEECEGLSLSMLRLILPITSFPNLDFDERTKSVIKAQSENLAQVSAILAKAASALTKISKFISQDMTKVERELLVGFRSVNNGECRGTQRSEAPRNIQAKMVDRVTRQAQQAGPTARQASATVERAPSWSSDDYNHIYERLKARVAMESIVGKSRYYTEAVLRCILSFIDASFTFRAAETPTEFAIVSLEILSHMPFPPKPAFSYTVNKILDLAVPIAFDSAFHPLLLSFVQPLTSFDSLPALSRATFLLNLLARTSSLHSWKTLENCMPSLFTTLLSLMANGSPFKNAALSAARSLVSLPLQEESGGKSVIDFWTSMLSSNTEGRIITSVLDSILEGERSQSWVLECVHILAQWVLQDRNSEKVLVRLRTDSAVGRAGDGLTSRRGLEGTLVRCLIKGDARILQEIADDVEKVALKADAETAKDIIALVMQAIELGDVGRRTWLADWAFQLAARCAIDVYIKRARARL